MPRYANTRNTFLGGELSKRADGRSDLAQHQQGGKQIRNFVVMPDGGITKRPGSRWACKVKGASGLTITGARNFSFTYSNTDVYEVMIWTASDGSVNYHIINSQTLADATVVVDADVDQDCTTAVVAAGGETLLFALENLQYSQSGDVMTFCGAGIRPFCIFRTARRSGVTEATFHVADYIEGSGFGAEDTIKPRRQPFLDENITAITMTPSVTTGSGTLTASAAYFTIGMVGGYMKLDHTGTVGFARITGYTNSTTVNITVTNNFAATTATAVWAESAWSQRRGYPRSITYYNRRLVFGGAEFQPDTFWMSEVGDYFQFDPKGDEVDEPMDYTLSPDNGRVNLIQWMVGGKKLSIGTSAEEHVGVVQEDGTNLNVQFASETAHGSAYIQPRRVAYAIPFVQASGRRVRELLFNFDSDSYVANDLTLLKNDLAENLWSNQYFENKITQIAYMESPYPVLWSIDHSGRLYGITRDRAQQVNAWHSHILGGRVPEEAISGDVGADHPAMVKSISVSPAPWVGQDRLWMVVLREIDGTMEYYLEYLDKFRALPRYEFFGTDGSNYYNFMDSAKHGYNASLQTSFSGFGHLEGETVAVMADGKYAGTAVVDSGSVTIPGGISARRVLVGLPYKARLKTTRTEGGSAIGSSTGSIRRVDDIRINIHNTRFFKFGFEGQLNHREEVQGTNDATQVDAHDSRLEEHSYIDPGEVPNEAFYPENGIIRKPAPAGYDDKAIAIVLSELPYPCTVLGITIRAVEADV